MSEPCKGCVYYETLKETVNKQQEDIKELKKGMGKLETVIATEKERVNNIFTVLKEIKASIDKIGCTIETIKLKPAVRWENLTSDAIKAIVILIIGVMVGKLIK